MNPLRTYILSLLEEHLKDSPVVVWYDPRREFLPFIEGGSFPFQLARLRDSHLALKLEVEPILAMERPTSLVIYLPGLANREEIDLLAEAVALGKEWTPQIAQFARRLLSKNRTAGEIDQLLAQESGYDYFCQLLEGGSQDASALRTIFPNERSAENTIAHWLADPGFDETCEKPAARDELGKLLEARLPGLVLGEGSLARWRSSTLGFILGNEFREDLTDPNAVSLPDLPRHTTKECLSRLRQIAELLRREHAIAYEDLAVRVQRQLGLNGNPIRPEILGVIDTFPFEEDALFSCAIGWLGVRKFDESLELARKRHDSFWVSRDRQRGFRWQLVEVMSQLGREIDGVRSALRQPPREIGDWIRSYARTDGWNRMDGFYRQFRLFRTQVEDLEPLDLVIHLIEALYEETVDALSNAFLAALEKAQWQFPGELSQARFWESQVGSTNKVAVFFVDALRLEMGWRLLHELSGTGHWALSPRVAMAPTITPVGMAAVLPSGNLDFQVADRDGVFAGQWGQTFLPGLKDRQGWLAGRVAGAQDLLLEDLLEDSVRSLDDRLKTATTLVVRSQEIDAFGEGGRNMAIQAMDLVIPNLRRAVLKLSKLGFEEFRIVSDHGFLFGRPKSESMKIDPPQGKKVDLHRRCWIGRGASASTQCVRIRASELGYASDLEFVFPKGSGVFKAGGDLAYHHGGLSLQELVVPVLVGHCKPQKPHKSKSQGTLVFTPPAKVTNRMVVMTLQQAGSMFDLPIRPVFVSGNREVSRVAMVQPGSAEFQSDTGIVTLKGDQPAVLCLHLLDDQVASVRLHALDATETNLLPNSPDITVELGI